MDDAPAYTRTRLAALQPTRRDNLRPEALPFIGQTLRWRGLWVVTEEDGGPYVGQTVWEPDDDDETPGSPPWFGWVPDEDLVDT